MDIYIYIDNLFQSIEAHYSMVATTNIISEGKMYSRYCIFFYIIILRYYTNPP